MVSIDIYLNETSRHADVILVRRPRRSKRSHYSRCSICLSVCVIANYSAPVFAATTPDEATILARLALIARGEGATADTGIVDREVLDELFERELKHPQSMLTGHDVDEVRAALDGDAPCDRELSISCCAPVPEGEGFGLRPDGSSLARLRAHPHGLDFGAMEPQLPGLLKTPSARIELMSDSIRDELARVRRELLDSPPGDSLLLIGRREFQSNNSWLHNLPSLAAGDCRQPRIADASRRRAPTGSRRRRRGVSPFLRRGQRGGAARGDE